MTETTAEIRASSNPLGVLRALRFPLEALKVMKPGEPFEAVFRLWYDPLTDVRQITGLRVISDGQWREERLGDGEITRIKITVEPGATYLILVKDYQTFAEGGIQIVVEPELVAILSTEKMEHMRKVADRLAQYCYGPYVDASFLDALESPAFAAEWVRNHGGFLVSEEPSARTGILKTAADLIGVQAVLLPAEMERFLPYVRALIARHPDSILPLLQKLSRKMGPWP